MKNKPTFSDETSWQACELPAAVALEAWKRPFSDDLVVTRTGCFSNVSDHFIHRKNGHTDSILIYTVKGRGMASMEGAKVEAGPGDLFLIPAGVEHMYRADPENPWIIHWVHYRGQGAQSAQQKLGLSSTDPATHIGIDTILIELFGELFSCLNTVRSAGQLYYPAQILHHIIGRVVYLRQSPAVAPDARSRVERVVEYIHRHINESYSVGTLAKRAGLSESYFAHLFQEVTGSPVIKYITAAKMQTAAVLLRETRLNVSETAAAVGYSDPFYFSRLYRQTFAVSPQVDRSKARLS
jgi:AraC family transcriptional regulator of arabinose operon